MTRTRKPRKKATTDLGRSIMQKERQRLAREQSQLAEKIAEDAARSRRAAANRTLRKDSAVVATNVALQRSIVRRVAGVLASEGVTVPMTVEPIADAQPITAWTDFNRIYVGYHVHEDIKLTAAVMRGLFYHEGGHCRFTLPFIDLEEAAAREAGYSTTNERGYEIVDVTGFRTAVAGDIGQRELHRSWNALEDQRMETAVVSDSPRKAGYFTPVMLSELCETPDKAAANWPLMVWRKYLPRKIRDGAKEMFVQTHGPVDGPVWVSRIRGITTRYVLGQNATDMYMAVVEMADVFRSINVAANIDAGAGHGRQRSKGTKPQPGDFDIPIDPSMEEEGDADEGQDVPIPGQTGMPMPSAGNDDRDADSSGSDDEGDDEGDDDSDGKSGDQQGDKANSSKQIDKTEGGATGTHTDDGSDNQQPQPKDDALSQGDLDEALAEAEDERMKDSTLDQDVQAFHEAKDGATSGLAPYVGGINTDPLVIAEANNLAEDIKRSFEQATVDMAPTWHEQQRRGVINVLRYQTRQAGDVEFFRAFVDNGAPGCDIAVSVLLDYSGSMGGSVEALAKVAYACKRAGDLLDIPVTVTLWDTDARVLWDARESAEYVPTIEVAGGTNPAVALDDLDAQMFGKSKHVVLIMTDDAWNANAPTLAAYKAEGRIIIGLGYTEGYEHPGIQASLETKGADFAYSIKDLAEIPRHLEQAIVSAA